MEKCQNLKVRLSLRPSPRWMVSQAPVLCLCFSVCLFVCFCFWHAHQVLVLVEAQGIVALLCPLVKGRVEGTAPLFSSRWGGGQGGTGHTVGLLPLSHPPSHPL